MRAARRCGAPDAATRRRGSRGRHVARRPARRRARASSRPRSAIDRSHDRARPVRPGLAAPPRARRRPASRAPAVVATPRIGIAYAGRAVDVGPVAVRRSPASPSVSGRRRRLTVDHPHGRALARAARVPARPRAARRGDLVPAVAPPRRGARAVVRPGHRGPRPRRDRPGPRAAPGAAGRRDRRGPRHRPVGRARGPRRPARPGPVPRDRRDARRDGPPGRRRSPTSAGRCSASSAASSTRCPALRSTLARSFDPVGELLDTASPRLGGLRAAVRVAYDRLRRRLDALVGSELGGALQEPIVTLRNGRYVVPVKAEARSRVKGIVHDASGSGQTLFVEPLVVVELGNAWREAQVAERRGDRPRSSTSCRRSSPPTRRRCARRSRRWPGSTSGRPRPSSPPRWTASGRDRRPRPRSSCSPPATRA